MTAVAAAAKVTDSRARTVFYGWDVYRRSQDIPWPMVGGGTVLKAQSRLYQRVEPYASGREPMDEADLDRIKAATADLIGAVRAYCDRSFEAGDSSEGDEAA